MTRLLYEGLLLMGQYLDADSLDVMRPHTSPYRAPKEKTGI